MSEILLLLALASPGPKEALTRQVMESGRVLEIAAPEAERIQTRDRIAPGAPPLLSFRFFEGKSRHRFGDLDLVMDDAGH